MARSIVESLQTLLLLKSRRDCQSRLMMEKIRDEEERICIMYSAAPQAISPEKVSAIEKVCHNERLTSRAWQNQLRKRFGMLRKNTMCCTALSAHVVTSVPLFSKHSSSMLL